jgi:hypothetical protein
MKPDPKWGDFRRMVAETMTHDRDAAFYKNPRHISPGRARDYMLHHPVWGLAARPALLKTAARLAVSVGKLNPDYEALAATNPSICATGLGLIAMHSHTSLRKFVDLWKPGGPLGIEDDAWRCDPAFVEWWDSQPE